MKILTAIAILWLVLRLSEAGAAPFIVSDPSPDTAVTLCPYSIDGAAFVDSATDSARACKIDMVSVAAGPHTIRARFAKVDPVWGRLDSVDSPPFSFTRPVNPGTAPGILRLSP